MPQGESQAGQGSAQAAPVAPPMPTTVTEVQQPNWWVVPKAPHPKLLPAAIAPALHADNTAREGKHQYVANFFSYLTAQEKIETAQEESFRVGHTHNEQDQKFSSVAKLLYRARTGKSPKVPLCSVRFAHSGTEDDADGLRLRGRNRQQGTGSDSSLRGATGVNSDHGEAAGLASTAAWGIAGGERA